MTLSNKLGKWCIVFLIFIFFVLVEIYLYRSGPTKSDFARALSPDLRTISSSLLLFKAENGAYPSTEDGLKALVEKPNSDKYKNWRKYFDRVPTDPWGKPYILVSPGIKGDIDVYSSGPDQIPGNEDDIGNWDLD